eukprot:5227157-Prymnesium_polylepis.1
MKVAVGSAATQCTTLPRVAFIPLSPGDRSASVTGLCGRGSTLLTAQKPPMGCSEKVSCGRLESRSSGGAAAPLSSGWNA